MWIYSRIFHENFTIRKHLILFSFFSLQKPSSSSINTMFNVKLLKLPYCSKAFWECSKLIVWQEQGSFYVTFLTKIFFWYFQKPRLTKIVQAVRGMIKEVLFGNDRGKGKIQPKYTHGSSYFNIRQETVICWFSLHTKKKGAISTYKDVYISLNLHLKSWSADEGSTSSPIKIFIY